MRLLLDTHTYLWLRLQPRRLPTRVADLVGSERNELFLSVVSLWEMTIKSSKGQLELPARDIGLVSAELSDFAIQLLGLDSSDLSFLESLPPIHKDPFDRALIAQAKRHSLTLVTSDALLRQYDVPILWN